MSRGEQREWAVEREEHPRPPRRPDDSNDQHEPPTHQGSSDPGGDPAHVPAFDFAAAWGEPLPIVRDQRDDLARELGEGGDVFAVEDSSWLLDPPPAQAATSLEHLPDLPAGTPVALRHPGGGFIPDLVLTRSTTQTQPSQDGERDERQALVTSEAQWAVRQYLPGLKWYQRWAPAADLFVYSDLPPTSAPPAETGASPRPRNWTHELDRSPQSPPVRRAVPAREAGSLLGRRLRYQARAGDWLWVIASSEPYSDDSGEIAVRVVSIVTWHLWQFHGFSNDAGVLSLALERAWVY